jgi:sugar (pentulose or hexulose) kinase
MSARRALIGIDVGTTRIKAVAFDEEGNELAAAEALTPWRRDGAYAETDADRLAALAIGLASQAAVEAGVAVGAIGVTGMGEAGVLLDHEGCSLDPVIAWHDPRGDVEWVRDRVGQEAFEISVGMPLSTQPSLPKILSRRRSAPASGAVRFLSIPEWVVYRLGGEHASELSLASRTGLLDYSTAQPWPVATELVGARLLAPIVLAGTDVGTAGGTDVPPQLRGAVLTIAGHDHQAAALAVGAARPGWLFDSLGTAEGLVRCVDAGLTPTDVSRLVGLNTSVGRGVVEGCLTLVGGLRTGLALEHVAAALGVPDRAARLALAEAACATDPSVFPLTVRRDADGVFLGPITAGVTPAVVWAAAVRDLVRASAELIAAVNTIVGPHDGCVVAGGWLRDPALRAAKTRQFGAFVDAPQREPGACGAAYLAGVAAGLFPRLSAGATPIWSAGAIARIAD